MKSILCLVGLLAVASAAPARAQEDADGAKDHPMFSRMPGYYIEDYDAQEFSSVELDTDPTTKVEGRYWKIGYWLKDGARKAGPVQIGRNYTDLAIRHGGRRVLEDLDASGGHTIAVMPQGGRNIWLQIDVSNSGEVYDLTVVEETAMEQQVEFTAADLARALNDTGSVALHDILFDTGKATIRPESGAALATVGDVLAADPTLRLEIQGHTDNVGAAAANLALSRARAEAVKAYLVSTLHVAADRLTTAGFGDTKPVADNATDAGRARNRRVELVKK
jgi:outer membrane protein OmpA-like peptidoglycan-associated protein